MKKKNIFTYWNRFHPWRAPFFKFLSDKKYWIFILVSAYCLADVALVSLRPLFLFSEIPNSLTSNNRLQKKNSMIEYTPIWNFNVFHSAAIPPSLSSEEGKRKNQLPQLSRLPIRLNGTIVYSNPIYSIANITVKNKDTSESYQMEDTVNSMAHITQITPERVYFINLNNNQEEYIEVPNIRNISFDFGKKAPRMKKTDGKSSSIIKKIGDFQFQVNRSDVNKNIRSLTKILQEAKMVPHWENGKMIGWRFKYIQSGSIYEQLELKVSDIVTSIEGELPLSQLQAAEMFQRFKNRSKLDIMVRRKGKEIPFTWDIIEDVSIEEPPKSRYY